MEPVPIPRKVSFFTSGFHPARFQGEVDPYFVCPVCAWVVRTPVACTHCETLICKTCHDRVASLREDVCPCCKQPFVPSPMRRYPSIVYSRYHLSCSFSPFGCPFSAPIPATSQHEDTCLFRPVDCVSPQCCSQFRLMDRPFPDKLVCSQKCWDVHECARLLEAGTGNTQCLELFVHCVGAHRDRYRALLTDRLTVRLSAAAGALVRAQGEFAAIQSKLATLRKQQSGVVS